MEAQGIDFRLRRPVGTTAAPQLTDEQLSVVHNTSRRLRVLAGPGTGKTATVVEAVVERVARGVDPEQILLLTFSRRASAELSSRLVGRLGRTTREPMVRTLHSYAYSLLRAHAVRKGEPAPRMLAAAESDVMIRELLQGNLQDGGGPWPAFLHQALPLPSFAAEVRDLLARCTERGITPGRMAQLGRRAKRPEWVALAQFAREFPDVVDLRTAAGRLGPALDQAELMGAALAELRDDETLAREQRRTRRIFVDEYQDVDPAQSMLIELLATGSDELVLVGDPDQSIYAFRGSDPAALRNVAVDRTVCLTVGRRMTAEITTATRRVAAGLPGSGAHRELKVPDGAAGTGTATAVVFGTAAAEAAYIADRLKRAHLQGGLDWSDMAVLVRSPAATLPALRRAFTVAGVPMYTAGETAESGEPLVAGLLTVLQCGVEPARLTGEVALELLASPLSGLDALGLRRLRRTVKLQHPEGGSSPDLLASILLGAAAPSELADDLKAPLARMVDLVHIARDRGMDATAEAVLWQLWQRCGMETDLVRQALRGGRNGRRADTALDAVVQLFETAAGHADLLAGSGVAEFVRYFTERPDFAQVVPHGQTGRAVQVLSAHAAKGLEWELVILAGVQEGSWPNLRSRGDLLGVDQLLDAAVGVPDTADSSSPLADERRLFYVATTRARQDLLVTAVQDVDNRPSRFLTELTGLDELPVGAPPRADGTAHRGLNSAELVANLRQAVSDPSTPPEQARLAAGHLATLAAAGIRGADPAQWWGGAPLSTTAPAVAPGLPVRVSPSAVEALTRCSLRAVLERNGGRRDSGQAQLEGIIVHALAHGVSIGLDAEQLRAELDLHLAGQNGLPPWLQERTRRLAAKMIQAVVTWSAELPAGWTMTGSELDLDVLIPAPEDQVGPAARTAPSPNSSDPNSSDPISTGPISTGPTSPGPASPGPASPGPGGPAREVRLTGRADWVGTDAMGRPVVVDFKTGATRPTKAEVADHAQLAGYQVAVALGGLDRTTDRRDGPPLATAAPEPGGADLVYLRTGEPKVLHQDAQDPQERQVWIGRIRTAAEQLASAAQTAQENKHCGSCPVRSSCPLRDEGRQVTR